VKLKKVLNNNVVIVDNEKNQELILIGRGISFRHKDGIIDETCIERTFMLADPKSKHLIELAKEIPERYFTIAEEIIMLAQKELNQELSDAIYISLTDHIYFIQERIKKNLISHNPLKWEIKRYYPREYKISEKAAKIIETEFQFEIPDDEIAVLALHIVNCKINGDMRESIQIIELISNIVQIIKYSLRVELNEESVSYQRLLTHLNFFVQRVIAQKQYENHNPLFSVVKENYQKAYRCVELVREFIGKKYDYNVSEDELTYLTIHIQRLLTKEID